MAGKDITNIGPLGGGEVFIDDVSLGHAGTDGVKLVVNNKTVPITVAQWGDGEVNRFISGQTGSVDFMLKQNDKTLLEKAFPGAHVVTDAGGNHKLTFGDTAGTMITARKLQIKSVLAALVPLDNFLAPRVAPTGNFELHYTGKKDQEWNVKFELLINEAGGSEGNWLCVFGDDTIVADAVAPTITGTVPADGGAAVNVNNPITFTASKDLDGNTVDTGSVILIKQPDDTGEETEIAGAVTLANAGAATLVTFTPTAALTAAKTYTAGIFGKTKHKRGVTDLAGNALVTKIITFTTA